MKQPMELSASSLKVRQPLGLGAALVSVLGRLVLAALLWVAIVSYLSTHPFSSAWQSEVSALIVAAEILVAIFVAWPIIACLYFGRKSG